MNSSPLNPDAPVFVPGLAAGPDVLLAESPRKPMSMDDIELPDGNQFQSEAVVRPAEIQDMDNCDQHNGHHNISMEGVTEHLNGNDKHEMESLGFGFNVGIDPEKVKDTTLIQDFERIQKDTTDFCNIQVFQAHTETNPFNTDEDDELFERLKNKERDPMSMSFYQEKDDDTCERFGKIEPSVDLNAVQPLPDSDDEDMQPNGIYQSEDKENVCPREKSNFFNLEEDSQEPNNDIMRFDDMSADTLANNITNLDNFMAFNSASNKQNYSNTEFECNVQPEPVVQTDTPESHKLLFEQIPEIPDGKSSELGFSNEDLLDPSESDKDVRAITPQDEPSQDIEMESKLEESPSGEVQPEISGEIKDDLVQSEHLDVSDTSDQVEQLDNIENEITTESEITPDLEEKPIEQVSDSLEMPHGNVIVDVHKNPEPECNNLDGIEVEEKYDMVHSAIKESSEFDVDPEIRLVAEHELDHLQAPASQLPSDSPIHSPFSSSPAPQEELLQGSPVPQDTSLPESAPLSQEVSMQRESPYPQETQLPSEPTLLPSVSPLPSESPVPSTIEHVDSLETTTSLNAKSPLPTELEGSESMEPEQSQLPSQDDLEPLVPAEIPLPRESPVPSESPLPDNVHMVDSKVLANTPLPIKNTKESSEIDAEMKRRIKLRNRQKIEGQISFLLDGCDSDLDSDTESSIELQTDTQIESEIQPQADSEQILQFEPETCVLDDMQQEPALADDNVDSQQHVEEPIHRSPLAVEQSTEETFSREQQDLSGLVQVADEMSEPSQPPSESPLPVEASLQEVIHRHIESPVCEPLRDSPVPAEPLRDSPVSVEPLRDSPVPDKPLTDSPVPAEPLRDSPLPNEPLRDSPVPDEPLRDSPVPAEPLRDSPVPDEPLRDLPVPAEPLRDSPVPDEPLRDSPVPAESLRDSPVPDEPLRDSPVPAEPLRDSPVPAEQLRDSPVPVEPLRDSPVPVDLNRPENVSPAPIETILSQHTIADNISPTDQTIVAESIAPAETNAPVEEIEVVPSSAPLIESDSKIVLPQEPDMKCEQLAEMSAPTPDIVPEERPRSELVTDIDIGVPESKTQECVPVTSESQHEDAVRPGATPPPTPAVGDATIAAAVAATTVAAVATAVKSSSPKKSPTTPAAKLDSKATPKPTAARTPASTKRVSSATTAARSPATAAARAPAARTLSAKASPAAPRAAAKPISSPAKAAAVPAKPAAISAKPAVPLGAKPTPRAAAAPAPRTTAAPRAAPAPRPAPKAPAAKPATAPPKAVAAAAKSTTTTTSKPATRPPPITRPPAKTAPSAPITKPKEVKAKAPGPPVPLTNGDVKPSAKTAPAARAPITRPAPRAAPRPAAPAAAAPARAAAPKPAARAPLDKQSKDLANKRITAKAAPPRTVPNKAPVGIKGTRAVKKLDNKKDSEQTLTNGASEQTCKAPPSPPADALLPDVIA